MIFNYLVVLEGGENGEGKSFTVFSLYCLNLDFFFFFFWRLEKHPWMWLCTLEPLLASGHVSESCFLGRFLSILRYSWPRLPSHFPLPVASSTVSDLLTVASSGKLSLVPPTSLSTLSTGSSYALCFSSVALHSISESLLNTYYVTGSVLGTHDLSVNKTDTNPHPYRAYVF